LWALEVSGDRTRNLRTMGEAQGIRASHISNGRAYVCW
jgi:hypothetical protein